mgnify:CR=1 FL=1
MNVYSLQENKTVKYMDVFLIVNRLSIGYGMMGYFIN